MRFWTVSGNLDFGEVWEKGAAYRDDPKPDRNRPMFESWKQMD